MSTFLCTKIVKLILAEQLSLKEKLDTTLCYCITKEDNAFFKFIMWYCEVSNLCTFLMTTHVWILSNKGVTWWFKHIFDVQIEYIEIEHNLKKISYQANLFWLWPIAWRQESHDPHCSFEHQFLKILRKWTN